MSKWYENTVFYHIYPLGFCGCPTENDGTTNESHFNKLNEWIEHIKRIGCSAIYIGPLFESGVHGYDTYDYKKVDSRIGTNEEFSAYVKLCHEQGIRVIVDGVFNHTGRGFFAFQDIKERREASAYKDWYRDVNFGGNNEYNDGFSYQNWGGHNMLPKLNQWNPAVKEYICNVIRFWVEEFDIDGIRLDAADVLDFQFMKELRQTANTVKEDFWLMGEVIHGDYSRWANGDTLHSVTNYELHKGLYSGHNEHNYFEIAHSVKRLLSICGQTKLYTFADNHDVERIYTKLTNKEHLFPLYMLIYSLPGIPSIYYGSEFAIDGKKEKGSDSSLRPSLELSDYYDKETLQYKETYVKLVEWISELGRLRAEFEEWKDGEYKELLLTNRQFAFARLLKDSAIITALNNDEKPATLKIPSVISAKYAVDLLTGEKIELKNGMLEVTVESNFGHVYHISIEE